MTVSKNLLSASASGGAKLYVEDVFSTYLWSGTGSVKAINNGIDLWNEGGLVWVKNRSAAANHYLLDTVRGVYKVLQSNTTSSTATDTNSISTFSSDGAGAPGFFTRSSLNTSGNNFASWTFRKAPKFFDIVTYTGDGSSNRAISHNLESAPGCIFIKRLDTTADWMVYHRSLTSAAYNLYLHLNNGEDLNPTAFNSTAPTNLSFTVGSNTRVNASGGSYVAYLFAHNAGGFGDDGLQDIISCGNFTTTGGTSTHDFGFEPQYVMVKRANSASNWVVLDTMRNFVVGDPSTTSVSFFYANASYAEINSTGQFTLTNSGIQASGWTNGDNWIYIAIRRPMKTPESGSEVFAIDTSTASSSGVPAYTSNFITDAAIYRNGVTTAGVSTFFPARLTGVKQLNTTSTAAESTENDNTWDFMSGWSKSATTNSTRYSWMFKRAPGFFDVVAYTGTGVARTVDHNLGVVPELMIVKKRNALEDWGVYTVATGNTGSLRLNTTGSFIVQSVVWNNTTPTSSVFTVGTNSMVNANTDTYVAYLFASCPGVSKVGSYTGNGSSQTINCGFSAGARFVLIKRTDSTGDWYVWDTARGIVSANDPHLSLNTLAAEVTTDDSVDPDATGFIVNQNATTNINVSSASYIFLSIS